MVHERSNTTVKATEAHSQVKLQRKYDIECGDKNKIGMCVSPNEAYGCHSVPQCVEHHNEAYAACFTGKRHTNTLNDKKEGNLNDVSLAPNEAYACQKFNPIPVFPNAVCNGACNNEEATYEQTPY